MEKIKVFVVDDHKIVRDGIISFTLGHDSIEVIGDAGNELDLLNLLEHSVPNVIVMDIALPGKNGIELTKYVTDTYPKIRVLILSTLDKEESIMAAVEAGAKGFLHKDCEEMEFLYAIEKVHLGDQYFGERITKIIQQSAVKNVRKRNDDNFKNESLTKRELEVIRCLTNGCSDKEMAEKLFISLRTVESHKKNIREKLKINSTAELVKYAIKNNIIKL